MIRSTMLAYHGKDIKQYEKVQIFLKQKSSKHKPKKSEVFSKENILEFLKTADDNNYLHFKVAVLFGLFGACRIGELTAMNIEDITNYGDHLLIKIPHTKTGIEKKFVVVGNSELVYNALPYYENYMAARPVFSSEDIHKNRFFLKYSNGKCTRLPIGMNWFGKNC